MDAGTKKFEDLEFQQLERESSLEEERETISQQLLQERAEYHSSVAKRKVRKLCFHSRITFLFYFSVKLCISIGRCATVLNPSYNLVLQEKMSALETQSDQLSLQASQECERLHSDRTHTLQMLQKVLTNKYRIHKKVQEPFSTEKTWVDWVTDNQILAELTEMQDLCS